MRSSRIRGAGLFGSAVVVVFPLGLVSAPVRRCFSHHQHAPATQAMHHGHLAADVATVTDADADEGAPAGCECLGTCHLETAPYLPMARSAEAIADPAPTDTSLRGEELAPAPRAPHAVPLARAPPALA